MKIKFLAALMVMATALPYTAQADNFGQSLQVLGPSKQVSATVASASTTLSPASGNYVYALNEGTVVAYVTCMSSTATVPGGSGPNSTPLAPNGGGAILDKGYGTSACAAITASGTASVDFTPVNLY